MITNLTTTHSRTNTYMWDRLCLRRMVLAVICESQCTLGHRCVVAVDEMRSEIHAHLVTADALPL